MADMLIDDVKFAACLDAEADAIRAKTGDSNDIPFDYANNKGFADAIAAIPSGGGGAQTISFLDWAQAGSDTYGSFQPSTTRIVCKHILYKCRSVLIPSGVEIAVGAAAFPQITNSVGTGSAFIGFWNGTTYTNSFTWFNLQTIDFTEFANWEKYYFVMFLRHPNNSNIVPSEGNSVVVTYDISDGAVVK